MVLESTVVCVDNSEWTRNGDFLPTRMQAQQDAVSLICHSKTRQNPENNVGLMTLASLEVLVTLTTDVGKVLTCLHKVQPKGDAHFLTGVKKAHLVLKHRQGKNHKMRIIVFVGSPIESDEKEIVKLAKKLKKEKVNVDIINFGEESINTDKLTAFVSTLNGKDGNLSHLVSIPPGPALSDALISSPVVAGEDGAAGNLGAGFEFGVDPNADPELALALRVSMEEQRQRQEEESRRTATASQEAPTTPGQVADREEAMLQQALSMSDTPEVTDTPVPVATPNVDFGSMSEEEQIAYAMQLSLQSMQDADDGDSSRPDSHARTESQQSGASAMETDSQADDKNQDFSEVMADPDFLQRVLSTLPGVDPSSDAIQNVMVNLTQQDKTQDEDMESDSSDAKKTDKK
ncbi:26S proteasome non-ATPase regulatory subunit 4 [Exaiptasia diaphana]|uniref:26S proteasome non-ATPase regulatory subunit 4 n=1 Tax=Exaiptasia diaphana TaxID=2652724 RepID=A0A913X797_EXADI|nr:26S proteasome non-ATPase regulatory subunit 4 [Exaiptasia diaphana]KXJ14573.1 26S proteasome non-ATPase regulatory subunit 4 [Exaiptasia diaphana]